MARASLIFRYQWRAFWRRVLRTKRAEFYLPVLTLLGGVTVVALPDGLSRAARELAGGQTASMDRLLLLLCVLWLAVLSEDLNVSLSSDRLRRFPIDLRTLLALRLFSIFLSPIAWLATIVSLLVLSPLLSAAHPVFGILAALWLFALTIGIGISVSDAAGIARRSRKLVVGVVALSAVAAVIFASTVATTVAVATTPFAVAKPAATLLVSGAAVWLLNRWSFVRRLYGGAIEQPAQRATSLARLPGRLRLGPLVQKEQRSVRTVLDLWMGLLLVLAAAALSLSASRSSTFRQTIYVWCAFSTPT